MARKILAHFNFSKNEIQNAVVQNLATPPGTPVPGQIYYNTATGRFEFRGASAWIDPTARDTHTGTQAAGTITGLAAVATSGLKADVGLGNVDNTSDATKSIGGNAATVTTNANLTGVVTSVGNATAIADAALSIAKTSGLQSALDLKAPLASPTFTGTVTVPTPVNATDASTKGYVDSVKQGLDIKDSVRVASTANIAVATALTNLSVIDGVTVATGDRVLLKNQTAGAENGIYVVVASGAASRATDADSSAEVTSGMYTFVSEGTASAGTGFVLTTADPITLGTTALSFTAFSGAGQVIAGNGLTKTGNTLSINTAVTADLSTAQTLSNKTFVTPALGTPASGVMTNVTGTASGLTAGNVTTNANLTGGVTSVGNAATVITNANLTGHITSVGNAAVLGSFTSAQLATALTDETGSGASVFATSPTLVAPLLGTPTSGVMTNVTGTAAGLTAGNVTTNANLTGPVTSTGNTTAIANGALTIAMTDGLQTALTNAGLNFSANVGAGTSVAITHGLGTRDVIVEVYDLTTFDTVECDVVRTSVNIVTLGFAAAVAADAYRVTIRG